MIRNHSITVTTPNQTHRWGWAALSLSLVMLLPAWVQAQSRFDEATFQGFLRTGEFAPAQAMIAGLADGKERDQRFAALAQAQVESGALRAADRTAGFLRSSELHDDYLATRHDASRRAGMGGGVIADFDPLMELISRTVAPESWEELGGTGRMQEFRAGVTVDPAGRLERLVVEPLGGDLAQLRTRLARDPRLSLDDTDSSLRLISLTRLERALRTRLAAGLPPTDFMEHLGGLRRIDALFVYPETGDLVIAGPAGPWTFDAQGRAVHRVTGAPTLLLDDLVAVLHAVVEGPGSFGCSIDPLPENLEAAQAYLATTRLTGKRWQEGLRAALGLQQVSIDGLAPDSHAAHVLVTADHHMKLIGMGIEPTVAEVEDVLTRIAKAETRPRDTTVIRWWFEMGYDELASDSAQTAFRWRGSAVKVLSENERLAASGERVRTGLSDDPTRGFAADFTEHFDEIAAKHPIHADLRNIFDLAMVAGLIERFDLHEKVDWNLGCFSQDAGGVRYELTKMPVPRTVESVMNVKEIERRSAGRRTRETLLGVSGGVQVDVRDQVRQLPVNTDSYGEWSSQRSSGTPQSWNSQQWWWDPSAGNP